MIRPMRLYLMRHGQTAWNLEGRAQGHTDVPLDDTGREQAACLARSFETVLVRLVLTSDLQRSLRTAEALAASTGARLEATTLLRERSFGEWEGLRFDEFSRLADEQGAMSLAEAHPPSGETLAEVWERLEPVARRLSQESGPVAVVSHGGVCGLLLARLVRGSVETARSFSFLNCAVTELERRPDGTFRLLRYNDCAHLARPAHAAAR